MQMKPLELTQETQATKTMGSEQNTARLCKFMSRSI